MINQALTMHPIFFDPINKQVEIEEFGKPETIRYIDDPCGVRLSEDGAVTFTLYAPNADTVEVAGITGSFPNERIALEKDDNGYFQKKAEGIKPGFHYFNWYVDGVQIRDPQSPICFGCFEPINFFEIPEKDEDFYFLKDVPHGDVQIRKYMSGVNSHMKTCYVYTPPGYSNDSERKYPVLYIQHGVGENETGWIWNGKLNLIMDNLIAAGSCKEMLVVMCSGYAFKEGEDPVFYPGDFDAELTKDCIPFIEKNFRVISDRKHRAMAGLSLGSAQAALTVGKHPDLFAYLGVFSGVAEEPVEKIMEMEDNRPEVVFLSCGKGETELLRNLENISEQMKEKGINCIQKSYEGFHEWHVWRKSLRDFVKYLFLNENYSQVLMEERTAEENSAKEQSETENVRAVYSEVQALKQLKEESILFFDPVYKQVIFAVDEKGRPAGRYKDLPHGVEVTAPGQAVFRMYAPGAKTVETDIFGIGRIALNKETDDSMEGWWTGSKSGISPGFHYHDYYVNGTRVLNPLAPTGYGAFRGIGMFEMPEEDFKKYIPSDVPHGSIHMNYYKSSQTGRYKLCYVYTPPDYDRNPDRRFPVLYLQHGGGENEIGWIWQGRLDNIADNMLADGRMQEMIIVMNTGYAFRPDGSSHPSLGSFDEELVNDCIPFIDEYYRTIPDRENRAMAGLSMGGMQTQKTVCENPGLFAWAGIFSGGLTIQDPMGDYSGILLDKKEFEKRFKLLFVACGTQDAFYAATRKNMDKVLECGIALKTFEEYGYHDWTFWRHCIKRFLPMLFTGTD
ncbi:MAG: enterochelin esterase [Lachnospiraceae bacterium]|nr:enterochelin esterase [Lachnospiraceae bacterium]